MNDSFITKIHVNESRNIFDFDIPLSLNEKKHLIITGKNGSGKTSLLEDINKFLKQVYQNNYRSYSSMVNNLKIHNDRLESLRSFPEGNSLRQEIKQVERDIIDINNWFSIYGGVEIEFSDNDTLIDEVQSGKYVIAYFNAKRESNLKIPTGVVKIPFKERYDLDERANQNFIQYIVNLKADRSFARDDDEDYTVRKIDEWFDNFENSLRQIMGNNNLKLKFDRSSYNFLILENNKKPYGFNNLSDGYSAIISIVSELLLRMEVHKTKSYDLEGIVLIDEIETHLHVELQKKILPFLTAFFPRIQFVVTTHSPFILSSVSNAIICDLESKIITDDLSGYSYDALIESYFNTDKYSEEIKRKVADFETLSSKNNISIEEKNELQQLKNYFDHVPKYLSNELLVKLQQIELNNLNKVDK